MAVSSIHNGWRYDPENNRLDMYYRGTRVAHINAAGLNVVSTVADVNTQGGIPVVYRINVAALGATVTSGNTDVTIVDKIRVIDVHAIITGGNGAATDNITVHSTGAAITDDMSWSGTDKALVRAATIDDAQHEIAANNILRVTVSASATDATAAAGTVYVTAIKVA